MTSETLKVVVADDHPLFRAGIVRALEEDGRFAVVAEVGDGVVAEAAIRAHAPDVALLDLRMPGYDGLRLVARLRHHEPPVAIVLLTAYTDASLVHSAMAAGAAGYAPKDTDREEILQLLVDVAGGRRRVLVDRASDEPRAPRPLLSVRERTVLAMLDRGYAPEEAALLCDMSVAMVNAHLANARRKLGAATAQEAIAAAAAWGLLA